MNIAYICDRNTYLNKMSRVRFHSMEAVGKVHQVDWFGKFWDGWSINLTVDENFDRIGYEPDLIVGYKPLEVKGFAQSKFKKCIRYNEMYDREWTVKEITESKSDIVICHHHNDYVEYTTDENLTSKLKGVNFVNVPHCAESTVFKDYGLQKDVDILLGGAIFASSTLGQHYPLRDRLASKILPEMSKKYKCSLYEHPGYDLGDAHTNRYAIDFAKAINRSKICVTCSGLPRSRFGKYVEIPMCKTAIAADMPDETKDFFSEFLINIDMEDSDSDITSKLEFYLHNQDELDKKTNIGYDKSSKFNQEYYAKLFTEKIEPLI
jgi:hypothetical protein